MFTYIKLACEVSLLNAMHSLILFLTYRGQLFLFVMEFYTLLFSKSLLSKLEMLIAFHSGLVFLEIKNASISPCAFATFTSSVTIYFLVHIKSGTPDNFWFFYMAEPNYPF